MPALVSTVHWRPGLNDPDPLGLVVTIFYLLASFLCFRRFRLALPSRDPAWLWLGAGFLLIGINKQLDLQTFLLQTGRKLTKDIDIYSERLLFHRLLFMAFLSVTLLLLYAFYRTHKLFFKTRPGLSLLIGLLTMVLVTRSASINHLLQFKNQLILDTAVHWTEAATVATLMMVLKKNSTAQTKNPE